MAWASACRSADRSLKPTAPGWGRSRTGARVPYSASPWPPSRLDKPQSRQPSGYRSEAPLPCGISESLIWSPIIVRSGLGTADRASDCPKPDHASLQMKIYISADIEGIAGITNWDEARKDHPSYAEFREEMTNEVLAACEGAIAAGATEILIKDAH